MGTLAALEQRVRELEATLAIMRLEASYARTWDTGDGAGWANLFTATGVFEVFDSGADKPLAVKGRKALAAFCLEVNAQRTILHLMNLPEITVDGDTARARVTFESKTVRRAKVNDTLIGGAAGYYEVRYRRTKDGWRMERRSERVALRHHASFFSL
ncbi:MAG: nuclear transport factor 2 family protein [Dehalococcoidia bacterium]|nr:nuclear transport factor 2 family protein [Dehalococcoidia bacterium]